jgi:hypothetical protein
MEQALALARTEVENMPENERISIVAAVRT